MPQEPRPEWPAASVAVQLASRPLRERNLQPLWRLTAGNLEALTLIGLSLVHVRVIYRSSCHDGGRKPKWLALLTGW